jgi:hypothetical protein
MTRIVRGLCAGSDVESALSETNKKQCAHRVIAGIFYLMKSFVLAVLISGIVGTINSFAQEISEAVITISEQAEVLERGEDFAVHRSIATLRDASGNVSYRTNQFTLLENGLHYFEDGQWKQSEDLVESFPDGAVARRGPNKRPFTLTEFVDSTEPMLNAQQIRVTDEIEMLDDTLIDFGSAAILRGSAFAMDQRTIELSAQFPPEPEDVPVLKQWQKSEDGRSFLIESVGWSELWPHLQTLPGAGSK